MKKDTKRLLFVFLLLLFFVGAIFLKEKWPRIFKKENLVFSKLKKEAVDKIVLEDNQEKTVLEKKNGIWYTKDFFADKNRVENLLNSLFELKKEEVVSQNKNKYKDFEVDGRRKIEIGSYTIYIGKNYSFQKSYFRVDNDPNVYLVSLDLTSFFYPKDFRDLQVYFLEDENQVDEVKFFGEGYNLEIKKVKDNWQIVGSSKKPKKERVDFWLNDIKTLKGNEVFKKEKINLSFYSPSITLTLKEKNKIKKGIFYKIDDQHYYFYQEGKEYLYQIPAAYVSSLKKEEKDLVE